MLVQAIVGWGLFGMIIVFSFIFSISFLCDEWNDKRIFEKEWRRRVEKQEKEAVVVGSEDVPANAEASVKKEGVGVDDEEYKEPSIWYKMCTIVVVAIIVMIAIYCIFGCLAGVMALIYYIGVLVHIIGMWCLNVMFYPFILLF